MSNSIVLTRNYTGSNEDVGQWQQYKVLIEVFKSLLENIFVQ
jgi:hypothetical protein